MTPTPHQAATELDVRVLATRISDRDRSSSIVVVTTRDPLSPPLVDATALAGGLPVDHDTWIVPASWTRLLEDLLGADAAVYGGAVRLYPAGHAPTDGYLWLPPNDTTPTDWAHTLLATLTPEASAAAQSTERKQAGKPGDGAGDAGRGGVGVVVARSSADGARLAEQLLRPDRQCPVLVVTVAYGQTRPWADVDEIWATVSGWCDVVVLHTGPATYALADRLPTGCEVFGGAGRVYPLGTAWLDDWDKAPLRFCYDQADGAWLTRTLIRDAFTHTPARHTTTTTVTVPAQHPVEGTVLGIVGGRGLVRLDAGQTATIWPETLVAGIDADQLLAAGMRVTGVHDQTTGRLDISPMLTPADAALADYHSDAHVLVRARPVTDPDILPVDLIPGVSGTIARDLVTSSHWPLADLVSPGEILIARILTRTPWTLSLDVDDTTPLIPAPALLVGGPAWLTPPLPDPTHPEPHNPDPQDPEEQGHDGQGQVGQGLEAQGQVGEQLTVWAESDQPLTMPGRILTGTDATTTAHAALTAAGIDVEVPDKPSAGWEEERAQLVDQLRREKTKTRTARDQAQAARTRLRAVIHERDHLADQLAALQHDTGRAAADTALFTDPVEQLRFEIHLAWARRIPAGQKHELPLRPYTISKQFLPSLDQVHGIDRSKVVDVAVDVLTGLAERLDGRELHQLRSADGGNAPTVTRDDGAIAWRCALQRGTASARRMHYWQLPDGSIELSAIRLHDDMRP